MPDRSSMQDIYSYVEMTMSLQSLHHLYLESSGEMTHLSDPPWDWLWPDGPPSGGRMTLDRFRRLKEPEPDLEPVPVPELPAALLVVSKLELFITQCCFLHQPRNY
jgi:hypothetical protein